MAIALLLAVLQDSEALLREGQARAAERDFPAAIQAFTRALELAPRNAEAWGRRGIAQAELLLFPAALKDLDRSIELRASGEMLLARARIHRRFGRLAPALQDLDLAVRVEPKLVDAYVLRAEVRVEKREVKGASDDLERALEIEPRCVAAYAQRARIRARDKDAPGADADVAKALEIQPGYGRAYYLRGLGRQEAGDASGGLADFSRAVEADPALAFAWNARGAAHYRLGDFAAALKDYDRAVELDGGYSHFWRNRGDVRRAYGNVDGAIADYTKAIEVFESADNYAARAKLLWQLGKLDAALSDADQAARLNFVTSHVNLRGCIRVSKGDYARAEGDFAAALRANSKSAIFHLNRGLAALRARAFPRALEHLIQACILPGKRDAAREELAEARIYLGDVRGALDDAWWSVYYGERLGRAAPPLDLLRRLERER